MRDIATEDERWMKLVCPSKYLKESESDFCRCGHHVSFHSYSRDDEYEKSFQFENLGKYKGERFCFKNNDSTKIRLDRKWYPVRGPWTCPCKGFEPCDIEKEATV